MNKAAVILLFLTLGFFCQAQQLEIFSYDWDNKPEKTLIEVDTSVHSAILLYKKVQHFYYEDQSLKEKITVHKKIKIFDKSSIDKYNKVFIPLTNAEDVITIKARVINKDGLIITLDSTEINEGIDEETLIKYKYFALEGVDEDSEIEYFYSLKKIPSFNGYAVQVQDDVMKFNYEYHVIAPSNLIYKFKSYNGLSSFKQDTSVHENFNKWSLKVDTVEAAANEIYCNYKNDVMRFLYKPDRNLHGNADIVSYGRIADNVYKMVYETNKKEKKLISNLIKDIQIDKSSTEKMIRSTEDYIKTNFTFYDYSNNELSTIKTIIENKSFNKSGTVKIYANIFKELGIDHQIVLTNNRFDLRFDKEFNTYLYLVDYFIWFPEINQLLSCVDTDSRLGLLPYHNICNYGLFIKEVRVNDFSTAVSKVRFIPENDYTKSGNTTRIDVRFNENFDFAELDINQTFEGYYAYYTQTGFDYITDEKELREYSDEIVNISGLDDEIIDCEILNKGGNMLEIKPLTAKGKIKTEKLIEFAGDKYIFKLGKLIGEQLELYEEKERKFDLELYYGHYLNRELNVKIPDGYTIMNPERVQMNEKFILDGDTLFGFESDYIFTDDGVFKVKINEWYDGLRYDKKYFPDFKRVINAAANFNKINLLFIKEE